MKRILSLILCLTMLISASTVIHSTIFILGDSNSDGFVNAKDVLLVRRVIAGDADKISREGDVNGDGQFTLSDLLMLKQHIVGNAILEQPEPYIDNITVSGVSIDEYTIVIPSDADLFTVYAAELLNDYIEDKTNRSVDIVTDDTAETEYEFLIGETNRQESIDAVNSVALQDNEYLLKQDGSKIVMLGNSYMIGAGVGVFTYDYITYDPDLTLQTCAVNDLPTSNVPGVYTPRAAKNAIFMIGDGMGALHPQYTLEYNANKHQEPDYDEFYANRLPNICLCTTYSLTTLTTENSQPTDSAASGTALSSGYKTYNHYLGVDENKYPHQNIRELAASLGKRNAVLSTERKEGATPSAFTVHYFERNDYDIIANIQSGITDCDYLKGDILEDLLPETKYALDMLSTNNDEGFFTMIEEAYIDKCCHNNDRMGLIHVMARFNNAIQYAMTFTVAHPDTLLVITADHECGGLKRGVVFTKQDHSGDDVKIYAIGGGSEQFTGTVDDTLVPKVIAAQWGVNNFGDQ